MRRVLFVDDEVSILDGLKRMLRPMREEWEMHFANGGEAALALLEKTPCDVIVTDMRMPEMDGAALLEKVREKYPSMFRIILSGYTELQASLRAVPVAHQFLMKPCEPEALRAGIARATSLEKVLDSRMLASLVGSLKDLPPLPRVYAKLKMALAEPDTSIQEVSEIVAQDVAVTAKLLQVVNSAFFGLANNVTEVKTAVTFLGLTLLQDLVLTIEVQRSFGSEGHITPAFLEEFQRHAQHTARIAGGIARSVGMPQTVTLAALLHDVGKLVIAERTPAHFERVISEAREHDMEMFEVEEQLTQISHAEVGAYLLTLWGLPPEVVEAVAHHHHPRRVAREGMDMLVVVYVANTLAREREALLVEGKAPELDMELMASTGCMTHLEEWRKLAEASENKETTMVK